jgi:NADPH2:quinone reductase
MTQTQIVTFAKAGGPEVMTLSQNTLPTPKAGQVSIKQEAIGVNYIDVYKRSGVYPTEFPAGLGFDAAGVVIALGEGVTHLKMGERVAYAAPSQESYASHRTLNAAQVCPLPDNISFEQAAAIMLKGMTTQYLFEQTTPLKAGDTVLFHAAAGGVGLLACQWAAAKGIILIGTAGSDEKCALALANGASHCINYSTEDFAKKVQQLTAGKGVDVVMDSVGAATFEGSLNSLKPFGMMITFGNASGKVPPVDVGILAAKGSLKLTRPTVATYVADFDMCQTMAKELFHMVSSGAVKVHIGNRYPMANAAQAHIDLESRVTTGSSILIP